MAVPTFPFDGISTTTFDYVYNQFNQLTEADGIGQDYEYQYPTIFDYTYDANGNLSEKLDNYAWLETSYDHDRHNHLVDYAGEDAAVAYYYDFSGRLLRSVDYEGDFVWTYYYYDGINLLLKKETSEEGNCMRTVSAFALKDAPIGQIISERKFHYAMAEECDVSYATPQDVAYMYDHIGNVIGLAEMSAGGATVMEAYDMEAFGRVMDGRQDGVHLTTKEYHPENDLYYFGARWYDPEVHRWLQSTMFAPLREHNYGFSENSPINIFDFNGHLPLQDSINSTNNCLRCIRNVMAVKENAERAMMNNPERANALRCAYEQQLADCADQCGSSGKALLSEYYSNAGKVAGGGGMSPGNACCIRGGGGLPVRPGSGPFISPNAPARNPVQPPVGLP